MNKLWKRIEVVITGLTRNQLIRKGPWVRIPPLPPQINEAMIQFHSFVFICGCLLDSLCSIIVSIKGGILMAWYTHQILADYLNRIENHTLIGKVLDDILAEDVVLTYGTQTYSGKAAVLVFFEDTSHAISSEFGFRATPVIICNTDDPEYNLSSDKLHTAVALLSKLETFVSWYFLLRGNEEFLINRIYGTRGEGYSFYPDVYSEGNFDYSGYLNNHQ